MSCGIYKIYFEDGSFYIGCSINIEKRILDHKSALNRNAHKNDKLQSQFNKYKVLNYVILGTCEIDQIYLKEQQYIRDMNATHSLNISLGGRGTLPGELHPSSKTSNLQAVQIVEMLAYTFKAHSDIAKELGVSIDTVHNISKGATHSWVSEEYPEAYADMLVKKGTRNGTHNTAEARGIVLPKVISPEGEVYSISSIRGFSREHGLEYSSLNKLLHGKQKTTKGWKIYNE